MTVTWGFQNFNCIKMNNNTNTYVFNAFQVISVSSEVPDETEIYEQHNTLPALIP